MFCIIKQNYKIFTFKNVSMDDVRCTPSGYLSGSIIIGIKSINEKQLYIVNKHVLQTLKSSHRVATFWMKDETAVYKFTATMITILKTPSTT